MLNASQFCKKYDFPIIGATYIGNPQSNSVMFVGKKLELLLTNLAKINNCLVFVDNDIQISDESRNTHCIIASDNPSREYAKVADMIWKERQQSNGKRKYTLTPEGYWVGENVTFGNNITIQPGCLIDHDVVIGEDTMILSGARIANAKLGKQCIIKQNAVIGGFGFVMSKDDTGNTIRIPSLGKAILGDEVEIGSFTTVCCGTGNDTFLADRVKIDDHVHIGHDVKVGQDTELTAGVIVGGYCEIGEHCFIGINSSLRNRIVLDTNTFVGMGAVVTKSFYGGVTVLGNPAKER